jgi:hypothetical protein
MNSLKNIKSWRASSLFSVLIIVLGLPLQLVGQCSPADYNAVICENADLFCLNQYCSSTPDIFIPPCCNNWCGNNTIIDNPQFFQFVAISSTVEFEIHVDYCQNDSGLQCGIIDACPWQTFNILDCNPGTPPGGTMILQANDLFPGQVYWLLIDGSNAAVCNFTITYASGIQDGYELSELLPESTFALDSVVCPGFNDLHLETASTFMDAPGYYWVTGWNGDTLTTSYPTIDFDVPIDAPEGNWDICVRAYSGCDSTEQICIPIIIQTPPVGIHDTTYFCSAEFPFQWNGEAITGPGDYTVSIPQPNGCTIDSIWKVYAYPVADTGMIDAIACDFYFEYEGHFYDQSGTYVLTYPGQGAFGCDSIAHLNLELHYIDAAVELHCQHEQIVLKSRINEQDESIDTLTYAWYSCEYDTLLSNAESFHPDTAGCFSLIINTSYCQDTIVADYSINPCEDSLLYSAGFGCAGVEMLLTTPYTLDGNEHADWTIDIPGLPVFHFEDQDSIHINIPIEGEYEAYVTIYDQDDIHTWIGFFEIMVGPEVTLCCDQSICSDSCTTFVITETHFNLFDVGFTNGLSIYGNVGYLTLEVCPYEGDPLNYTLNHLSYTNFDCPGTVIGDSVIIINALDPPLVFIVPFEDTLCTYPNDLASYRWRYCDSTTILSTETCFAPPASGCFCLEVENEIGCSFETCTEFILSRISYIQDDQIKITPNPSAGDITVELPSIELPIKWQLNDTQGKFITAGEMTTLKSEVRLTPVLPGIYFLKFSFGKEGYWMKKIIIQ